MSLPSSITPPFDLTRAFSLDASKDQPIDRAKVATLAREFESMLLLQMVRQLRQSLLLDDEQDAGLGNETMTETFDVEFARYLARAGGVGLARMIEAHVKEPASRQGPATGAKESAVASPPARVPTIGGVAPTSVARATATSEAPAPSTESAAAAARSPSKVTETDEAQASHLSQLSQSGATPGLVMPLESDATSKFGWRADPFHGRRKFHSGVDLRAAYGTEVPAAGAGTVTFAGERGGYGLLVVVAHANGLETRYAHLASTSVRAGQGVGAGEVLGRVGSSGRSTAPHLHFEVLLGGRRLDPEQVAARRPGELVGLPDVLGSGQSSGP